MAAPTGVSGFVASLIEKPVCFLTCASIGSRSMLGTFLNRPISPSIGPAFSSSVCGSTTMTTTPWRFPVSMFAKARKSKPSSRVCVRTAVDAVSRYRDRVAGRRMRAQIAEPRLERRHEGLRSRQRRRGRRRFRLLARRRRDRRAPGCAVIVRCHCVRRKHVGAVEERERNRVAGRPPPPSRDCRPEHARQQRPRAPRNTNASSGRRFEEKPAAPRKPGKRAAIIRILSES